MKSSDGQSHIHTAAFVLQSLLNPCTLWLLRLCTDHHSLGLCSHAGTIPAAPWTYATKCCMMAGTLELSSAPRGFFMVVVSRKSKTLG